jgi:hypothetical protein
MGDSQMTEEGPVADQPQEGASLKPLGSSHHLRLKDAAAWLDISSRMLQPEVAAGRITPYNIGRRTFFTLEELHRYVGARVAEARAERARRRICAEGEVTTA